MAERGGRRLRRTPAGPRRSTAPQRRDERAAPPAATVPPPASGPFILGAVPGATPGRWIDAWKERMPASPLDLRAVAVADQRDELLAGAIDAALVRLPIDRDGLSVIALYDELPVVVVGTDSHLTAVDELTLDDLVGEVVITAADDVLGVVVPGAAVPSADAPATTADAVALVAAGAGVVIVPMSLARAHARRDVASRPLRDGPTSTVALSWVTERTTPAVETFVGIVRGRTANSSR